MDRQYTDQVIVLNAAAADGASVSVNMRSFKAVLLQIAQVGFTGTIKLVGSNADAAPDFSVAASASNPYDTVTAQDLNDQSTIDGDTGIVSVTQTSVRQLELNSDGLKWIGVVISNRSAGSVTVKASGYSGN